MRGTHTERRSISAHMNVGSDTIEAIWERKRGGTW